jgi:hypothetical protein
MDNEKEKHPGYCVTEDIIFKDTIIASHYYLGTQFDLDDFLSTCHRMKDLTIIHTLSNLSRKELEQVHYHLSWCLYYNEQDIDTWD